MALYVTVNGTKELQEAAEVLLNAYPEGRIFAIQGEMGAGKTTFIKALCHFLGSKDTVSSPTFSLVNEYHTADGQKIFHFDFYRIRDISELFDMGYEEYFYSGAKCFIEWPEKIKDLLPEITIPVKIEVKENMRIINVEQ